MRILVGEDGKTYHMKPTDMGFFEGYIFYDEDGNILERFYPDADGDIAGMFEDYGYVTFVGKHVRTRFFSIDFHN